MYTVSRLSKLSGVSIRTLHYYDEIGLLIPSYKSESGYRYYTKEQLLILQQILFFKEIGFELKQVHKILKSNDFDKINALKSHKKIMQQNIKRMKSLIITIDKTINHLEKETIMKDQEIFWGFKKEKQKEYEQYLIQRYGKGTEDRIAESYKNIKNWKKEDWDYIKIECDDIYKKLVIALENNIDPESKEVQELTYRYFLIISKFYKPTKEVFSGLGQLYIEHPDFRKVYDKYHPKLAEYLAKAMKIYSEKM